MSDDSVSVWLWYDHLSPGRSDHDKDTGGTLSRRKRPDLDEHYPGRTSPD